MYEQIALNNSINDTIYRCFEFISEADQRKFVKKFREQPHNLDQVLHTLRELILGAYLSSNGFKVRNDYPVNGKTPDWSIIDDNFQVICIIELTNFHLDKTTDSQIKKHLDEGNEGEWKFFWRDENKDNVRRLYNCIEQKADTYRNLVEKLKRPYVVSLFDSNAAMHFEEIQQCVSNKKNGLFDSHLYLSGVLYFRENSGKYSFSYACNSGGLKEFDIPSGVFPPVA